MEEAVIVAATRIPVGKFLGMLAPLTAPRLGAIVVREVIRRAGIDPAGVDECILGNVISAGLGQNPARQAALFGGLPNEVAAMTVNKVCGSGLKAVCLGVQAIQTGNAEIVIAGGMESMSNAPYLLPQARQGLRMGHGAVVDSILQDGLWDVYNDCHMGITAEHVAEKHAIGREEQDRFALESHRRAAAAWQQDRFRAEVVPVEVTGKKGATMICEKDEAIRPELTMEALAALKPVFRQNGTVTAGNAPGLNDAAAAVLLLSASKARVLGLQPMATVRGQATSGVDPKWVMLAPVSGVRKLLAKIGWTLESVDLFELNEAFAVQALGVMRELELDAGKVNVNGGAVAIGHPIGASGARILVTLVHEMVRRDAHRGIAVLCLGGGNSVAIAIER